MTAEQAQHFPINGKDGKVYLFNNLKLYLRGSFELIFSKDCPTEKLASYSLGSIMLRSKDGIDSLFMVGGVTFERFRLFAEALGLKKKDDDPCFYIGSLNVDQPPTHGSATAA